MRLIRNTYEWFEQITRYHTTWLDSFAQNIWLWMLHVYEGAGFDKTITENNVLTYSSMNIFAPIFK